MTRQTSAVGRPARHRPPRSLLSLGLLLALALPAQRARAQAVAGFALDRFDPASAGSDWFALDSLDLRGGARPAFRVGLDWAHKPLVLYDRAGKELASIAERQVFLHLGASLNVASRLRLGVDMPVAVSQTGAMQRVNGFDYPAPGKASAGDLRAAADLRLVGPVRRAASRWPSGRRSSSRPARRPSTPARARSGSPPASNRGAPRPLRLRAPRRRAAAR